MSSMRTSSSGRAGFWTTRAASNNKAIMGSRYSFQERHQLGAVGALRQMIGNHLVYGPASRRGAIGKRLERVRCDLRLVCQKVGRGEVEARGVNEQKRKGEGEQRLRE